MTTIDETKVDELLTRVQREVDDGLLPSCQLALAVDGQLIVDQTFGADTGSRYVAFSCTKALVAATVWRLMGEGAIDISAPVVSYLPEFGSNGKDKVIVEHLLLHTGGFPWAPLGPPQWFTREGRLAAYDRWRLDTEPGSTFTYHPTAGHWVLADIIEAITATPFPDALEELVTEPLGLPRLLGIPVDEQVGLARLEPVGEIPSPAEMEAAFGVSVDLSQVIPPDVAINALLALNAPDNIALGVPGGGGVMRAADLALFYQGLLHNPGELWDSAVLADGTGHVRNHLPDLMGIPANRSLGLVIGGDDGNMAPRGFGRTASPRCFGHDGAGGQIAFADPETGLSVAYFTNGLDQHLIRERRRTTAIASRAAICATSSASV